MPSISVCMTIFVRRFENVVLKLPKDNKLRDGSRNLSFQPKIRTGREGANNSRLSKPYISTTVYNLISQSNASILSMGPISSRLDIEIERSRFSQAFFPIFLTNGTDKWSCSMVPIVRVDRCSVWMNDQLVEFGGSN